MIIDHLPEGFALLKWEKMEYSDNTVMYFFYDIYLNNWSVNLTDYGKNNFYEIHVNRSDDKNRFYVFPEFTELELAKKWVEDNYMDLEDIPYVVYEPEFKKADVAFCKPGGASDKDIPSARISLPINWIKVLGITPEDRNVILTLNEDSICIKKVTN